MAISIKTEKTYYVTEASIETPCSLGDLSDLMRAIRGTGKIVAVYSDGGLVGINLEQKTRMSESDAKKVREILGIGRKEI